MNVVSLEKYRNPKTANCHSCKHVGREDRFGVLYCKHPSAKIVDRVMGPVCPRIDGFVPLDLVRAHLNTCDENGWFQEKKHWWERIFP